MDYLKITIVFIALMLEASVSHALCGYAYEQNKTSNHVIHIVTINPENYIIDIVKAKKEGDIGRETVSSIAKRSQAEIAINGGFFEIGANKDGMPSGTLVIKGTPYAIKDKIQPLVVINSGALSILLSNPKDHIKKDISMVSGIPLLLKDGKIFDAIFTKESDFYTSPHARTALGVKPDGKIIIVMTEHHYSRDLTAITMGEVQSLLTEKGDQFAATYQRKSPGDITLNDLKKILKNEFTSHHGPQGMTILELAQFMKDLGCKHAINLDGGGSSTLWIKDKVVNQAIGDKDEGNGLQTIRPVSDVIIFKKP